VSAFDFELALPSQLERASVDSAGVSDEALINTISIGDADCLAVLFSRYAPAVRAIGRRILRDTSEADDLVQDVFSEMPTKCASFDPSKGVARSWILRIAYHSAISRRRYLNSRHFYNAVELDNPETFQEQLIAASPPADIEVQLQKSDLRKLFEALSENQRKTLELFFCEGYTLDEIAVELGQSKGNVRHHYFRGLEKLRKEVFSKASQLSDV
jgi:RNA polymerase sigma-70 factor (ECF subfamily)